MFVKAYQRLDFKDGKSTISDVESLVNLNFVQTITIDRSFDKFCELAVVSGNSISFYLSDQYDVIVNHFSLI